jgi:hypothetical protein
VRINLAPFGPDSRRPGSAIHRLRPHAVVRISCGASGLIRRHGGDSRPSTPGQPGHGIWVDEHRPVLQLAVERGGLPPALGRSAECCRRASARLGQPLAPGKHHQRGMQLSVCTWPDSGNNQGAAVELACGPNIAPALSLMSQVGSPFTVDGQTVAIYAMSNGSVASVAAIGNPPDASISITPWQNVPQSVITQALTGGAGVVVQQGCH